MAQQDRFPTDQLLARACCATQPEAWTALFDRYGETILEAIRKALGHKSKNGNLVDEIYGEVCDLLFEKKILTAFEAWRGSLGQFLGGFAAKQVEHYFQTQKRRRSREVPFTDVRLTDPAVAGEGLDATMLAEFLNRLTRAEKNYCVDIMLGAGTRPAGHPPLSGREQKLVQRIYKKWEKFQQEDS